jgi:NADP-dependent 3-hydroxy acid dehydrogenase YdfG
MPSINDSKCVLVIGATAGIGRALALAIHKLPTNPVVIVAGRRQERLDELVKQGDGRIHGVQVDVTKPAEELKKYVDGIIAKFPNVSEFLCHYVCQSDASHFPPTPVGYGCLFLWCPTPIRLHEARID